MSAAPQTLKITPIKTAIFHWGEDLNSFLRHSLRGTVLKDGDILVITSKIVSLSECQTLAKDKVDKAQLIISEADYDLGEVAFGCRLTIKHGLFIPSAGIDESNSEADHYILFPKDPFLSAQRIHQSTRHPVVADNDETLDDVRCG